MWGVWCVRRGTLTCASRSQCSDGAGGCGGWVHPACVGLSRAPEGAYVCPACDTRNEARRLKRRYEFRPEDFTPEALRRRAEGAAAAKYDGNEGSNT